MSANLGFLWKQLPLPDAIGKAAAAGFAAVECHQPFATPAATVKAALDETGLPLICLNASFGGEGELGLAAVPGRADEARRDIDEAVEYAAAIGARFVSVFAGRTGRTPQAEGVYRANLAYAAERAEARGVGVILEPLNTGMAEDYHLVHVADAVTTIEAVGAPNLSVMADTWHVMTMEGSLDVVAANLGHVGHVQFSGWPDRAEPDHGIEFDAWLPALIAAGYDGHFGAEYNPATTEEAGLGWLASWQNRN